VAAPLDLVQSKDGAEFNGVIAEKVPGSHVVIVRVAQVVAPSRLGPEMSACLRTALVGQPTNEPARTVKLPTFNVVRVRRRCFDQPFESRTKRLVLCENWPN
jgi:hypothetical protein